LEVFLVPFTKHGVQFLVIGGQAERLIGSPHPTFDVHLCYLRTPENLERVAALRELGVTPRGAPADLPFKVDALTLKNGSNFTFDTPVGKLDVLGYVEPLGEYPNLEANHEVYDVDGQIVKTISLDDLLKSKPTSKETRTASR